MFRSVGISTTSARVIVYATVPCDVRSTDGGEPVYHEFDVAFPQQSIGGPKKNEARGRFSVVVISALTLLLGYKRNSNQSVKRAPFIHKGSLSEQPEQEYH